MNYIILGHRELSRKCEKKPLLNRIKIRFVCIHPKWMQNRMFSKVFGGFPSYFENYSNLDSDKFIQGFETMSSTWFIMFMAVFLN